MSPFYCTDSKWYYTLLSQEGSRRVLRAHDGTLWVRLNGTKHCVGWISRVHGGYCYNGADV